MNKYLSDALFPIELVNWKSNIVCPLDLKNEFIISTCLLNFLNTDEIALITTYLKSNLATYNNEFTNKKLIEKIITRLKYFKVENLHFTKIKLIEIKKGQFNDEKLFLNANCILLMPIIEELFNKFSFEIKLINNDDNNELLSVKKEIPLNSILIIKKKESNINIAIKELLSPIDKYIIYLY